MFRCGMDFQSIPLNITHSFQHFEPIQYVNNLHRYLLPFQVNDPNATIDLNDFHLFWNQWCNKLLFNYRN
jgi:hypothetical protein